MLSAAGSARTPITNDANTSSAPIATAVTDGITIRIVSDGSSPSNDSEPHSATAAIDPIRPATISRIATINTRSRLRRWSHLVEPVALRQQAGADGVDAGETGEHDRVDADDHREVGVQQGVDVELDRPDLDRSGQQGDETDQTDRHQRDARQQQQPPRREEQEETQVPPTVPPRAEVRLAAPAVGTQDGRDLTDVEAVERCAHHHLAGVLHPGGMEVEVEDRLPPKPPHPAVEVADLGGEQPAPDERQDRVADDAVHRRHRPWHDPALEAVPHHEVGPGVERVHERPEVVEGVAVVGVGDDHVVGAGTFDPGPQRSSVAAYVDVDHDRTGPAGDLL